MRDVNGFDNKLYYVLICPSYNEIIRNLPEYSKYRKKCITTKFENNLPVLRNIERRHPRI